MKGIKSKTKISSLYVSKFIETQMEAKKLIFVNLEDKTRITKNTELNI